MKPAFFLAVFMGAFAVILSSATAQEPATPTPSASGPALSPAPAALSEATHALSPLATPTPTATPAPSGPDPAEFYATLLSTLGAQIENLELTLDGAAIVRRADPKQNPLSRLVTVRRDAWPMSVSRMAITAGEPENLDPTVPDTPKTLVPLQVDIGTAIYRQPIFTFTQLLWEPSGNEQAPQESPETSADFVAPGPRAVGGIQPFLRELNVDRFEIREGTYRHHRVFHEREDIQGDIREELVIEAINVTITDLHYRAEGATTDLAPTFITARLLNNTGTPTLLSATGHLVPEYEQVSFKLTGTVTDLYLPSLQPLIPYHAGIYLTDGVADIDFVAQCSANHLIIEHDVVVRNAQIRQSDQKYNPFLSMAMPLIKSLDEVHFQYTVEFTIGAEGEAGDFGKVYGRDIRKALERQLGPKLAAGLTIQAPVTVVKGVFNIVQAPFRLFIGANRPKKPERTMISPPTTPTPKPASP